MAVLNSTNILQGASIAVDSSYRVKRSARFNDGDSAYLNRTPAAAGNRKTWTWSGWVKRTTTGSEKQGLFGIAGSNVFIRFNNDDGGSNLRVLDSGNYDVITNRKFRDISAWYHIVVVLDTTQGTDTDRIKIYVNNVRETSFYGTPSWPGQNDLETINNNVQHVIGVANSDYLDGYLADIHFIDGTAKAPGDFAEPDSTTGQWVPKKYEGSYGTNGFHLAMDPANGGANYSSEGAVTGGTLSNPENAFNGSGSNWATIAATNTSTACHVDFTFPTALTGVTKIEHNFDSPSGSGDTRGRYNGANAGATRTGTGSGYSDTYSGSAITVTSVGWGINQNGATGTSSDIVSRIKITDSSGTYIIVDHTAIGYDSSGKTNNWHENNLFGREQTTANENFKVVKYTGTAATKAVTGLGFKPDLVWLKRADNTGNHNIQDVIRGAAYYLQSDATGDESNSGSRLASFDADGFTLTSDNGGNTTGGSYVAWCWKAGGTPSALNTGSINASVSANTAAGFSIVSYTGTGTSSSGTVAHGLGKKPDLIIAKSRDTDPTNWFVWHSSSASNINTKYALLNSSAAVNPAAGNLFATVGTTTFGVEQGSNTNNQGEMIAYCWAETEGHSKFGSIAGGSDPVIDCGFAPALVIVKRTDAAGHWYMYDKKRGANPDNQTWIEANGAGGQQTHANGLIKWLPNGFQLKGSDVDVSGDLIYAAFAGSPAGDLDLLADAPGAPYDNELNGGGNYATLNPLDSGSGVTLSDGNLKAYIASSNHCSKGNFAMSSGKWYWEINITQDSNNTHGIAPTDFGDTNWCGVGDSLAYNGNNGQKYTNSTGTAYGATHGTGDVIGTAFDADSGSLTFYKNGISQGVAWSNVDMTKTWVTCCGQGASTHTYNYGQRSFGYTPPTGYKALNTYNLTDPTITKGNTGFDAQIWTGNDGTTTISGMGFSPDLMWIKNRDNAYHHALYDTIRGNTAMLSSSESVDEETNYGDVTSQSTGFEIDGSESRLNSNNQKYVGWTWDAGSAGSNTVISAGSLNSSVYLQGEVYSGNLVGYSTAHGAQFQSGAEATKAFDGVIGDAWNEGASPLGSGTGTYIRFTPSSQVASNTVEVYVNKDMDINFYTGSPGSSTKVAGPFNTSVSDYFTLVNCGTVPAWDYMQMDVSSSGTGAYFGGILIGGKLLVDSNVTPANAPLQVSTYRVNTATGFSVVTATAPSSGTFTVAHGLNAKPDLIIGKDRDNNSTNWAVYHSSRGATKKLDLDSGSGEALNANYWANAEPTSLVLYTNAGSWMYGSADIVLYCWSEVAGYSKFGSYVGNNSDNFIWMGFKPRMVITKSLDSTANWNIVDTARDPHNRASEVLAANLPNVTLDNSFTGFDVVSNGIVLKSDTNGQHNYNGVTFIYAAWSDSPFKFSNAH